MKKHKVIACLCVSLFLLFMFRIVILSHPVLAMSSPSENEERYREILLRFYSQELVAHGAMLFAASAATFRFITGLIGRTNKRLSSKIVFLFFSGILIGLAVYLGFRLLYYGALTSSVTTFDQPVGNKSYAEYARAISDYTETRVEGNILIQNFFETTRRSIFDINPFNILPISLYIGFALAYSIFYAFGCHPLDKKSVHVRAGLFFLFGLPAAMGLVLMLFAAPELADNAVVHLCVCARLAIPFWWYFLVPILCYCLVPILWFYGAHIINILGKMKKK